MSPMEVPDLRSDRLWLRSWRPEDLGPFAAMNADPRVMAYFPAPLSRSDSDGLAGRIQRHLNERGFGLWAVDVTGRAPFIGFIGLSVPSFSAHFTPAIEVGWRLAREHWGHGYATEGARRVLAFDTEVLRLAEIVSFTAAENLRSRAVMERIGMRRDPADDFDHPGLAVDHVLRRHVLYRYRRG